MKIIIPILVLFAIWRIYAHFKFKRIADKIPEITEEERAREEQEIAQRHAILKKLVVYRTLQDSVSEDMPLNELINVFEKMCSLDVGEPDDLLFETGTYNFTGEKQFYFDLVRQFQFLDNDEYVQLRLSITCEPSSKTFGLHRTHWGKPGDDSFFRTVYASREYQVVKDLPFKVAVRVEDT